MNDLISRQESLREYQKVCNGIKCGECPFLIKVNTEKGSHLITDCKLEAFLHNMPSAQPEWNNHTVACVLAELFDDTCACNYNGIDEWLPGKCELLDSCPNPVGVACWEQYLKHRAERGTDEGSD